MDIDEKRKLFNVIFEMGIMIHNHVSFADKSTEEVAEWMASQLNKCGFYNIPIGACWGVPVSKEVYDKYQAEHDKGISTEG